MRYAVGERVKKLSRKLMDRSFPAVFLRLILYIYLNQSCYIRWNSVERSSFLVKNGVSQGEILSPFLLYEYLDTLLAKLRDLGRSYFGSFGYAEYFNLLAPCFTFFFSFNVL